MITPPITILPGGLKEAKAAGYNARWNVLGIKMFRGVRHPAATLMQEVREWRIVASVVAFFWAAAIALSIFVTPAAVVLAMAPIGAFLFPPAMRALEARGHAVEVLVAAEYYGYDMPLLLEKEARVMSGYKCFKGWSRNECFALLVKAGPGAERWVSRNRKLVQKWALALPESFM